MTSVPNGGVRFEKATVRDVWLGARPFTGSDHSLIANQAMHEHALGRAPPAEYLTLPLRAHELLRDVPVYDVSIVDLPGGGIGRTVRDIRALEATAPPSRIAVVLFAVRRLLGRA